MTRHRLQIALTVLLALVGLVGLRGWEWLLAQVGVLGAAYGVYRLVGSAGGRPLA